MGTISINIDTVFKDYSPRELSSWSNATDAAKTLIELYIDQPRLRTGDSTISDLCDMVRDWAKETGAWDEAERNSSTTIDCVALFLQNVAVDMRAADVHHTAHTEAMFTSALCEMLNSDPKDQRGSFFYYVEAPVGEPMKLCVEWSE